METDNNTLNYSAADIEKYHRGLLSAKERHALEKAALDDPFLADALEGYAVEGVDAATDIKDLKERLAEKTEEKKVIAIKGAGKSFFPWMRAAAVVIVVAGAGILAKQFIPTPDSKEITKAEPAKKEEIRASGNSHTGLLTTPVDSINSNVSRADAPSHPGASEPVVKNADGYYDNLITTNKRTDQPGDRFAANEKPAQPVVPAPMKSEDDKSSAYKIQSENGIDRNITVGEFKTRTDTGNLPAPGSIGVKDEGIARIYESQKNKNGVPARRMANNDAGYRPPVNYFRGMVTDANNVGLPFARVYNPADNYAGTYTDAKGYFTLTHPDSVLNVQVRFVGFEMANVQLRNNPGNYQVILHDDKSIAAQTLPAFRKINSEERSRMPMVTLEEPEPADGWDNYDTYLTNNLNMPEEIKTRHNVPGQQVELSFEVDKNGEPINIKVEKSLCSKCDQEAIRLIKEGPKWKRHAKKGRTTVKIPFDNSL